MPAARAPLLLIVAPVPRARAPSAATRVTHPPTTEAPDRFRSFSQPPPSLASSYGLATPGGDGGDGGDGGARAREAEERAAQVRDDVARKDLVAQALGVTVVAQAEQRVAKLRVTVVSTPPPRRPSSASPS